MATKKLALSPTNKLMLAAASSMLGDLQVKVDHTAQHVTVKQNDQVEGYSYEQLASIAEQLFPWRD